MGVKVFDLQLLVGRENIMGDKPRICIESTEICGKNLYVGTNDCFIYHYVLQSVSAETSYKEIFSVVQQGKKHVGMKKPVVQIKAASALNHLLLNCDNTLVLLSMLDLSIATAISGKIKNMSKFCVNEHPLNRNPFSVEICVSFTKRKSIQTYQVHEDRVISMHEVSLPEHPRNFCVDGRFVCVGTTSAYIMVNSETGAKQDLFPLDDNKSLRMITGVGPTEFLIAASNALGVFVSSDGTSNRPPLQWSDGVFATTVSHPYIIALDDEFITVHSLLDQQQKQSVAFQGGAMICHGIDGIVIVCTPKDVFLLSPVPLQTQLNTLLAEKQVEEAVTLLKASKRKVTAQKYTKLLSRVYCMSGFVKFQEFEFNDAMTYFADGCMDPRELIALFPTVLPIASEFKRSVPSLHSIADINEMCDNDSVQVLECQEFLALYLEVICDELFSFSLSESGDNRPTYAVGMESSSLDQLISDVFYSTVLIFGKLGKTSELKHFIEMKITSTSSKGMLDMISIQNIPDLVTGLQSYGCYHVCALIHINSGEVESAMKIWYGIVTNKYDDPAFPGLMYVAKNLGEFCHEAPLLWKNAEWILEQDQHAGVEVFTNLNGSGLNNVQPDDIIDFLHQYPDAVLEYLFHLVIIQKLQKEKFHTHLAVLCLKRVLQLKSNLQESFKLNAARKKLQEILNLSDLYQVHLILGKARDANLFEEQVILHSKLGEHQKALEILVHKVGDPIAAKEYCLNQSESNTTLRQQLFRHLLTVYLQDISVTKGATASTAAVMDLLNQHPGDFEFEGILHLLPNHWSISVLTDFLNHSIRVPLHELKLKAIEYMLAKSQVTQLQQQQVNLHSSRVTVQEGRICKVCNKQLSESTFARYPNGTVVHLQCSKDKHICPVTGKIFKTKMCSNS